MIKKILAGEINVVLSSFKFDGKIITNYKSIVESFNIFFLGAVSWFVKTVNQKNLTRIVCKQN